MPEPKLKLAGQRSVKTRRQVEMERIELSHEKEGWTPIEPFEALLPTDEIHESYDQVLQSLLGKV